MKKIALPLILLLLAALVYWLKPGRPAVVNPHPAGSELICFGDSLTAGVGASAGKDYPAQLAGMLHRQVINLGVPGDTTGTAVKRLDQVLDRDPGIVLLTLGGNDIRRGIPQEEAFANLEQIVRRLQERGALVVIGGIDIPFLARGFGDGYRQLARRTGSLLVENVFAGIWGHPELMSDQVHPNPAGYRLMADHFRRALGPYL